jgi:hypothetical protein
MQYLPFLEKLVIATLADDLLAVLPIVWCIIRQWAIPDHLVEFTDNPALSPRSSPS